MKDHSLHGSTNPADYLPGMRVKLPNRRVALWRGKDGGVVLQFKSLHGWKRIVTLLVPLSADGAKATLDLLAASQPRTLRFKHTVEVP